MWQKYLVVALGGATGAVARYAVGSWAQTRFGTGWPYGTFLINMSGSFVLGLFATLAMRFAWSETWRLLIAIGFLGAYTTFSTFTYESLQLIAEGRQVRAAVLNVAGSLIVGLLAAYLGVVAARVLLTLRGRL
jgi:fluoride exporter